MPILMWLFLAPFIAGFIVFFSLISSKKIFQYFAFLLSLIPLVILLYHHVDLVGMKMDYPWIPQLSIQFFLTVDSLSLIFLYLTAIIIPISILSVDSRYHSPHALYCLILILQGLLIGFFTARDLALFTIFWEAMLLPLYFIINTSGGEKRQQAALQFLVYMIAGSTLMIAGILFLYFAAPATGSSSFSLDVLQKAAPITPYGGMIFAIFLLAFAVKTPLFPFHAWLPDAYTQAPTVGTILLSALLSKAGIYGILRIGMEIFPTLLKEWSPLLLSLAIIGVFYGGLAALWQKDFKYLIAYSSFSHVNFILAGLFIWHEPAQAGAILQTINHSVTITGLFLVAGWLEKSLRTTVLNQGGLAKYFPNLCWLTMIFVLSAVALPGTNAFVSEFMIFFGLFGQDPWIAAILGLSIILSVMYMLRFMQNIYFGEIASPKLEWKDIGTRELLIAAPLIFLIFWIGIYPKPFLEQIKPAIETIVTFAYGESF